MSKPMPWEVLGVPKYGSEGHDTVLWCGTEWFVTDVRWNYSAPEKTVLDLRRTVVVNPNRRYLDEAVTRRNVSITSVSPRVQ